MAETSKIEWTDATWNPITGCTMVSAGCTNCYAMGLAATRLRHHPSRAGLTRMTGGRAVWTGAVRLNEQWLDQPLRWKRPRRIFVCAHGDLFHENVPDDWIDRVFAVMAHAPHHTFQVLTKRPERAREYMTSHPDAGLMTRHSSVMSWAVRDGHWTPETPHVPWPLPNVWLGTSVEDQATADARIPDLLATPAAVVFLSCEPPLGPLTINPRALALIDWIIVGGESGPNARPMHPDWARSLRDQCQAAGVAFHFNQWGEWAPDDGPAPDARDRIMAGECQAAYHDGTAWQVADHGFAIDVGDARGHGEWVYRTGKRAAGRRLDGRTWDEFPEVQHG